MTSSPLIATTPTAPGWWTTSRSPAAHASTSTEISLPRNTSRTARGCTSRSARDDDGLADGGLPAGPCSANEFAEQGVRSRWPGPELGMELPCHEVGVVRDLDDLHEPTVGRLPGDHESALLQDLPVRGIDLVPVPMTLVHDRLA